jgi:hypothetical protein
VKYIVDSAIAALDAKRFHPLEKWPEGEDGVQPIPVLFLVDSGQGSTKLTFSFPGEVNSLIYSNPFRLILILSHI